MQIGNRDVDPEIGHGKLPGDARAAANTITKDVFFY
jgi:hypothetical protein